MGLFLFIIIYKPLKQIKMSAEKKAMPMWVEVLIGTFIALTGYGFLDRFVFSKIANHLEHLIEGED